MLKTDSDVLQEIVVLGSTRDGSEAGKTVCDCWIAIQWVSLKIKL